MQPGILLANAVATPRAIAFRRPLSNSEGALWLALRNILETCVLTSEPDEVDWGLTSSRNFSVKSMYERLSISGPLDMARGLWKAIIPLKVKIPVASLSG